MFTRKAKKSVGGYVYIASNPAMHGLVKIGMTSKQPSKRVAALYNTSVPLPFVLRYYSWVPDRRESEKHLHSLFAADRVSKKREFFAVPAEEAIRRTEAKMPYLNNNHHSTGRGWKLLLWIVVLAAILLAAYKYGYGDNIRSFLMAIVSMVKQAIEAR